MATPRLWNANLVHSATLTPSSECLGAPVEALAVQLESYDAEAAQRRRLREIR